MTDEDAEAERRAVLARYGNWDAARRRFDHTSEDINEALRLESLTSIDVLERELGPDWPKEAMFDDDGLGAFLVNGAGWPARQLVIAAREFDLFKDDPAWPALVHKLQRPRSGDARSTLFQLHVAYMARQRGLGTVLEPPAGTGKVMDVLVRDLDPSSSHEVYIECMLELRRSNVEIALAAARREVDLWRRGYEGGADTIDPRFVAEDYGSAEIVKCTLAEACDYTLRRANRPLTVHQILEVFDAAGREVSSPNAHRIVYAMLRRNQGRFTRVGAGRFALARASTYFDSPDEMSTNRESGLEGHLPNR